jgi:hypothetical protein
MATCTLQYAVNATGIRSLAQIAGVMASAPRPSWITAVTGATFVSDATAIVGSQVVRTIVYDVSTPIFEVRFPGTLASKAAPFFGLMTGILRAALNQPVIEAEPAVA